MVGLYYKRREQRAGNKYLRLAGKIIAGAGALAAALFAFVVIFFNGEKIKGPLSGYLSAKSGMHVSIGSAEFSPLYPNVVRLTDISFGKSRLKDLYVEYDLKSMLAGDELKIADLYIRGLQADPEELAALSEQRLGFKKISAALLRINDTAFDNGVFSSESAGIRLKGVSFDDAAGLSYASGRLTGSKVRLFDAELKDLSLSFERSGDGLVLKDFSAGYSGGVVSGEGVFTEGDGDGVGHLHLSTLNLSKVIRYEDSALPGGMTLTADTVNLSNVIVTNEESPEAAKKKPALKSSSKETANDAKNSFLVQNLTGTATNLCAYGTEIYADFTGAADEISMPKIRARLLSNAVKVKLAQEGMSFSLQGSLFEGQYKISGTYDGADKALDIEDLALRNNKIEFTPSRRRFLTETLAALSVNLHKVRFQDLEFLSYLDRLPVSVQRFSGEVNNIILFDRATERRVTLTDSDLTAFNPDGGKPLYHIRENAEEGGEITLRAHNLLYSDLRVKELDGRVRIKNDMIRFDVPKMRFKESALAFNGEIRNSLGEGRAALRLRAENFESADLNSNLLQRLLTGYVDLSADLESGYARIEDLRRNLQGRISLESSSLLISDLGLDLINGGGRTPLRLDRTELLTAINGTVAGINDLSLKIIMADGKAKSSGSMRLATCNVSYDGDTDLKTLETSGGAVFISSAEDSLTRVEITGDLKDTVFDIRPEKRGIHRPGLYLPQYSMSAPAKEQTDAKGHLKERGGKSDSKAGSDASGKEPEKRKIKDAASANEKSGQDVTAVKGQSGQDVTAVKGQSGQDDAAAANGQNEQDVTAVKGQSGQDVKKPRNAENQKGSAEDQAESADATDPAAAKSKDGSRDSVKLEKLPATPSSEERNGADSDMKQSKDAEAGASDARAQDENLPGSESQSAPKTDQRSSSDPKKQAPPQQSAGALQNGATQSSAVTSDPTRNTESAKSPAASDTGRAESGFSESQKKQADMIENSLLRDALIDSFFKQDPPSEKSGRAIR